VTTLVEFLAVEEAEEGVYFGVTKKLSDAFEGTLGGVVAACSLVAARAMSSERRPFALDCRFLRSLEEGYVYAEPWLISEGRTTTVVGVQVMDEQGTLVAIATASFVERDALHPLDDSAMVRPGASVTYAEASPLQLRRVDTPILGTLQPRVKLTEAGLIASVLRVPWDDLDGTGPEAACLAADLSVGPPVAAELGDEWVPHPNPDLSLRFASEDTDEEVAGVTRLERVGRGVAAVRIEVFSGIELVAVGCSTSLLLGSGEEWR
jgi:acyl-coenzyme A thioesterase PaaI-like protein